MAKIGYARVSTEDQSTQAQADELRAAGCDEIHEEQASGGSRTRPILVRLLERVKKGDTIVVVRIDRMARSLSHLLDVIEDLETRGAHFRSLHDPIDTASPQGKFTLQVLGAAAELERALIRERTMAGLKSARGKGRIGGNPGLVARDPAAIRKIAQAKDETIFTKLEANAQDWVPEVRRLRPGMAWEDVTAIINGRLPKSARQWTQERLVRAAKRYVREGLLPPEVLVRSKPRPKDDRLLAVVAAIAGGSPDVTLQAIVDRLEAMREKTPRGKSKWQLSSVKMLVDRARAQHLII